MGKEIVLKDGKVSIGFGGGITVTADALKTLRQIAIAYGIYSDYEESPDLRVELVKEPVRELAVMAKTSTSWQKIHTLTRDSKAIDRYLAFRMLYRELLALEHEEERKRLAAQKPTGTQAAFAVNDVFGEQHEPTLDDVFGKLHKNTMEDIYSEQNEEHEPTFYSEYAGTPEPTMGDLFGEQYEPTLNDVFGGAKE